MTFTGLPKDYFAFFAELSDNNDGRRNEEASDDAAFLDDIEMAMQDAKPLMKFLCEALGAPFQGASGALF